MSGVTYVRNTLGPEIVSERRACRELGQPRSAQRREPYLPDDEPRLVKRMIELATQYGRYGYRTIWGDTSSGRLESESQMN